ncbi:hypothetical protein [Thermobispora bispora]|uniref:hypothetical protein n=1 Tax=Thermobispora bispora TaxID=2006 RepID=UPI0019800C43|nr:hypothetical protein [Thermobispora bispora]QSI49930.1 hypothetical protein CYL17_18285 [Thermobispora bispora]QSI50032.1 hypothetical protein CYL17_18855 [Thermobispora bispora]
MLTAHDTLTTHTGAGEDAIDLLALDLNNPLPDEVCEALGSWIAATHPDCLGWTHDPRDPRVICWCGQVILG